MLLLGEGRGLVEANEREFERVVLNPVTWIFHLAEHVLVATWEGPRLRLLVPGVSADERRELSHRAVDELAKLWHRAAEDDRAACRDADRSSVDPLVLAQN